jgi:hypothetical protein
VNELIEKLPWMSLVVVARTVLEDFPEVPASARVMEAPEMGFLPPVTLALTIACGLPGSDDVLDILRELHPLLVNTMADTKLDMTTTDAGCRKPWVRT